MREAGEIPDEPDALARRIKALPLRLLAPAPIERAISTAGGVEWREIDAIVHARESCPASSSPAK